MMKMRQLIAAAIVLAALTATLYWSNHRKPVDASANAASAIAVRNGIERLKYPAWVVFQICTS